MIPEPLYNPGETVYYARTRITATIKDRKYYGPAEVRHSKGLYAQLGWRYELVGAEGLHYFEWQFSRQPGDPQIQGSNGWEELRDRFKE